MSSSTTYVIGARQRCILRRRRRAARRRRPTQRRSTGDYGLRAGHRAEELRDRRGRPRYRARTRATSGKTLGGCHGNHSRKSTRERIDATSAPTGSASLRHPCSAEDQRHISVAERARAAASCSHPELAGKVMRCATPPTILGSEQSRGSAHRDNFLRLLSSAGHPPSGSDQTAGVIAAQLRILTAACSRRCVRQPAGRPKRDRLPPAIVADSIDL